jgi:hypothetical protein
MMRWFSAPAAVLGLIAVAHLPSAVAKPYPAQYDASPDLRNASHIEQRQDCPPAQKCGYYGTFCCALGQSCATNALDQAICVAGSGSGAWQYSTTTWVANGGPVTYTSVYSSYIGAAAAPTGTGCANSQPLCGGKCCDSGFWCGVDVNSNPTCQRLGGGSSGGILPTPSAPLRPTSTGVVVITYTGTPTATVPFQTPIPTGAAGSPIPVAAGGGGLSGGAIAGIVIGVILGILLLLALCLFCCARALFDTLLGILGLGKRKNKHTHEETYIEEHHHSGGAAASGGRRWYGAARPARPARSEKSGVKKGVGVAAALGGLALMLGLKRKHDAKHDDKSTTVSGSSYYYSDYTSSSKSHYPRHATLSTEHATNNLPGSASSDDRRTRNTRHSSRR